MVLALAERFEEKMEKSSFALSGNAPIRLKVYVNRRQKGEL
jgi:hypothetical protein